MNVTFCFSWYSMRSSWMILWSDDITLVTEKMEQAQGSLHHFEHNAAKIGLHQNAEKTEFMGFNQEQETVLKSVKNENIKKVDNFK